VEAAASVEGETGREDQSTADGGNCAPLHQSPIQATRVSLLGSRLPSVHEAARTDVERSRERGDKLSEVDAQMDRGGERGRALK
jgi:hypothetical protein